MKCYEIAVESAEKNSDRREATLGGYIAIMAIILGAMISFTTSEKTVPWYVVVILGLTGAAISFCYYKLIRRFTALSEAKFKIISGIEKKLPIKVFGDEWGVIQGLGKQVPLLSTIERVVTVVVGLACLLLMVAMLIDKYSISLVIMSR